MRKYSLDEIDRMRAAVQKVVWRGVQIMWTYDGGGGVGRQTRPSPEETAALNTRVEEQLRTYMLNGTEVEELEQFAARTVEQK